MDLRLLLLEDDGVSAAFLRQALAALPATVAHAGSLAAARALVDPRQQLWLFDARLPDGHGAGLLQELRAAGWSTPALALTADDDPRTWQRLLDAGFLQVLAKPLGAFALQAAVRRHLVPPAPPRWDDAAALAALGGSATAVQALRRMFLDELPGQGRALAAACAIEDPGPARELLHRLKASCGFVGASALLQAVQALDVAPADRDALADFQARAGELVRGEERIAGETAAVERTAPG